MCTAVSTPALFVGIDIAQDTATVSWLRPAQLPGRFVCVYCLRRFELVSQCPNCGEHQTIARMSRTEDMQCQHCGHSMLRTI